MTPKAAALAALLLASPLSAGAAQLGVYEAAGCNGAERVAVFEKWLGHPVERIEDFIDYTSWVKVTEEGAWATLCWYRAMPQANMVFAVPMLPRDRQSTFAEVAAGAHDATFSDLGAKFVRGGFGNATLRIGWEFNGGWFPWSAKPDPKGWVAAFRHIVSVFRAVPGAHFRIDWNPNMGQEQIPPDQVYPGDDVVDEIGLDVYNQAWGPNGQMPPSPQQRWQLYLERPFGLNWLKTFGAQHHKPIALPEWGTGTRPDGHGGGDDPYFVEEMAEWIKANNVAYHIYFDANVPGGSISCRISEGQFPAAAAAFRTHFGR